MEHQVSYLVLLMHEFRADLSAFSIAAGTSVTLAVRDSTGNINYSSPLTMYVSVDALYTPELTC